MLEPAVQHGYVLMPSDCNKMCGVYPSRTQRPPCVACLRSHDKHLCQHHTQRQQKLCVTSRGTTYFAGAEVAEDIRRRVQSETKLTCSVGIGPNGMLAKVASDINKPNGQYILPQDPASLKSFVQRLSLRKVPGIGKVRIYSAFYNAS